VTQIDRRLEASGEPSAALARLRAVIAATRNDPGRAEVEIRTPRALLGR
jgi:hypothetical protein